MTLTKIIILWQNSVSESTTVTAEPSARSSVTCGVADGALGHVPSGFIIRGQNGSSPTAAFSPRRQDWRRPWARCCG